MANQKILNRYGAKLVTCEVHFARQAKHIYGLLIETAEPTDDECPVCRDERSHEELPGKVRAALLSSKLSHTRARSWGSATYSIYIYHYDSTSPSGVMLAVGCDEKLYNTILAQVRAEGHNPGRGATSPLSPTEKR